jgi:hypothetical protein
MSGWPENPEAPAKFPNPASRADLRHNRSAMNVISL